MTQTDSWNPNPAWEGPLSDLHPIKREPLPVPDTDSLLLPAGTDFLKCTYKHVECPIQKSFEYNSEWMNEGCYDYRSRPGCLYKLLSTPYGRGGDSDGKTSFRDFDELCMLRSTSWENLFHLMEAIVICHYISRYVSLLLVDIPHVHKVGGCGKKVFMREIKALSKEGTV